jgi:hypothetical protein
MLQSLIEHDANLNDSKEIAEKVIGEAVARG